MAQEGMFREFVLEDVMKHLPNSTAPISIVNGDTGNTTWKRHPEGFGQNLKTVQERCS